MGPSEMEVLALSKLLHVQCARIKFLRFKDFMIDSKSFIFNKNPTSSSTTSMGFQGLEWVARTFSLEPTWTREPNVESAKHIIMSLGIIDQGPISISFLAQGAFNKLYDIMTPNNLESLILRVTLPVDPRYKTLSEVATMNWVRENTNVRVPRVIAYEASSQHQSRGV